MNRIVKKYIYFPLLLLIACTNFAIPTISAATSDAEFATISEDFISGYLAWRPQTGTSLGFHQYDGKVTDYSKPSLEQELARLKDFDRRLGKINTTKLTPLVFSDYRLLRGAIQREIFSFEQMEIYTRNPMTYATALDVNIYIKRNFAPLEERVRSIISVLKTAPQLIQSARNNLVASLPRPHIETAIEEADGVVEFLKKDLVEALKPVENPMLMADFGEVNKTAIKEMKAYVSFLKAEKLPKATDKFALGHEKYARMLECGEMITLSPDHLLEVGLGELKRTQQKFAATARQINSTNQPIDVFNAIQKDHPTEQSLIPDVSRNLESIRKYVADHHLVTLPSPTRAQVTETPQFLRASSFASMDTPGPFETKATEVTDHVTPVEPDWPAKQKEEWLTSFNYYTTDVVTIHEAYPGHYVQFLCLNASKASRIEKIFSSYAFVEGWAHYSEQMMLDEGFGTDGKKSAEGHNSLRAEKYRLAQIDEALLRICRLCVSIKMHCQGMTVDKATKFFKDNCYYEEKPARQEAIRGAFDPEYLYYTVGKLQILKLREDYRKQEGKGFSLQKFHDEFLRHGAPPIRLLREVVLKDPSIWDQTL